MASNDRDDASNAFVGVWVGTAGLPSEVWEAALNGVRYGGMLEAWYANTLSNADVMLMADVAVGVTQSKTRCLLDESVKQTLVKALLGACVCADAVRKTWPLLTASRPAPRAAQPNNVWAAQQFVARSLRPWPRHFWRSTHCECAFGRVVPSV